MAVKPMNCPGHLLVYRDRPRSHNEFPLRFSEMGLVHRRELSGVRHGLFRVQAFTQDDAHHFCTLEQIEGEIGLLIDFFKEVYGAFDLDDVRIELSHHAYYRRHEIAGQLHDLIDATHRVASVALGPLRVEEDAGRLVEVFPSGRQPCLHSRYMNHMALFTI